MLLGDSVRISYQPTVARLLEGEAEVVGPMAENCQFILYTLAALPRLLGQLGTPDVVHWNNGLHDMGHNPDRCPRQTPIEMYVANLGFALRILQDTGAKIIWATTTPVYPGRPFVDDAWSWVNEDIDSYNRAAVALMKEHDVAINDLNAVVRADYDACLHEDQLHLSEEGIARCAEAVAAAVRKQLD